MRYTDRKVELEARAKKKQNKSIENSDKGENNNAVVYSALRFAFNPFCVDACAACYLCL